MREIILRPNSGQLWQLISAEFTGGPRAWDASAAEGRSNDTARNVTAGEPVFPILSVKTRINWCRGRTVPSGFDSGLAFGSASSRWPNGLTPLKWLLARPSQNDRN
jgi:hypothetical protein